MPLGVNHFAVYDKPKPEKEESRGSIPIVIKNTGNEDKKEENPEVRQESKNG
jgi:hypothetical protein